MFHIALAGRRQYRAGTEEQQALEDAVIEDMEQRRSHGDRRSCWHRIRLESKRKPQADEDDTYVLDGAVGQELLQVTLKNS